MKHLFIAIIALIMIEKSAAGQCRFDGDSSRTDFQKLKVDLVQMFSMRFAFIDSQYYVDCQQVTSYVGVSVMKGQKLVLKFDEKDITLTAYEGASSAYYQITQTNEITVRYSCTVEDVLYMTTHDIRGVIWETINATQDYKVKNSLPHRIAAVCIQEQYNRKNGN